MKSYSRSSLGEVLLGVVDHMIGAEAADQVCLSRAAHCGDLGSHRFGDLDGVYADAPSGTVDEDRLPRLDLADVTNGLEGCQTGHRQHRGLLESEAGWFRNELALFGCGILGERALAVAEDLITRFEARDLGPDSLHRTCHVVSGRGIPRAAQAESGPHHVGSSLHEKNVTSMDRGGAHANQHFIVTDIRLVHLNKFEDVGSSVFALDDRLHRIPPRMGRLISPSVPVGG